MELLWAALIFIAGVSSFRRFRSEVLLSLFNLALVYGVFFKTNVLAGAVLFGMVCLHYLTLRFRKVPIALAYVLPVLTLIAFKSQDLFTAIGASFLAFRLLSAASEVQARIVSTQTLSQYLFYCFYFPTMKLGPIGSLADHLESLRIQRGLKWFEFEWPQLARIAYGGVKYFVFTKAVTYYAQALGYGDWESVSTFPALLATGFCSFFKLYLSFSGFTDMAVGLSHFLKFRMKENFLHPFKATNVGEFWSNWHVSLTDLLKELIFIPLNLKLLKRYGTRKRFILTPPILLLLYVAIGLWHGIGWNFVVLGVYYAFGAIVSLYFSAFELRESRFFSYVSIVLTQTFIALSFLLIENPLETAVSILQKVLH